MFRRTAPVLLACLLSAPGLLSAQYFGRNKVQYTDFDFKVIQTEHFDIYYYDRERTAALEGVEPRVPRAEADHPVRVPDRLHADQRHRGEQRRHRRRHGFRAEPRC